VDMEKIPEDWATRSHSPRSKKTGVGEGPTTVRQTARFSRNIQSLPMVNHAKKRTKISLFPILFPPKLKLFSNRGGDMLWNSLGQ